MRFSEPPKTPFFAGEFPCISHAHLSWLLFKFLCKQLRIIILLSIYRTYLFTDNIPVRLYVGLMIFISCVISYMLRTNLSINILAMVQGTQNTTTDSPAVMPEQFNMSKDNITTTPSTTPPTRNPYQDTLLPDVSVLCEVLFIFKLSFMFVNIFQRGNIS